MKKITYRTIAKYFLSFANSKGELMTNLKLQKLLYYAQAWHLANYSKSLFEEDFEAWVHGPVIPELYIKFKKKGYYAGTPIKSSFRLETIESEIDVIDKNIKPYLRELSSVYFSCGAYQLELMTHKEDPWIRARKGFEPDERCNVIITKESMQEYYGKKI